MRWFQFTVLAAIMASVSLPAAASETVIGGGLAKDCQNSATQAADLMTVESSAFDLCDQAIKSQAMSLHDLAATYVNRGILYLVRADFLPAESDFRKAIDTLPALGGAHCNYGAALIAQRKFADGITEIGQGLALGTPEPEKSYFNRGLAREDLGDLQGAYGDLKTASRLKPDWQKPREELARFIVKQREY